MAYRFIVFLDANLPQWKDEAKWFLNNGIQFAMINTPCESLRDCMALARQFDFTCTVLDKEVTEENYLQVQPKILGFVHKDVSKRVSH
jgi:hypothetical protein